LEIISKPIDPINNIEIEMMKYFTYYYYEQLKRAYEFDTNEFLYLYYTFLEHIIYSYGKYNGIALSPRTKIYQYIFDKDYYLNKNLKKISDNTFLELLKKCMQKDKNEIMYKNISEINEYLMNYIGGLNIDGWKIRSEIK
jgi:hypothetical protein